MLAGLSVRVNTSHVSLWPVAWVAHCDGPLLVRSLHRLSFADIKPNLFQSRPPRSVLPRRAFTLPSITRKI